MTAGATRFRTLTRPGGVDPLRRPDLDPGQSFPHRRPGLGTWAAAAGRRPATGCRSGRPGTPLVAWASAGTAEPTGPDHRSGPARPARRHPGLGHPRPAGTPVVVTIPGQRTAAGPGVAGPVVTSPTSTAFFLAHRRDLTDPPAPELPEGYTVRPVRGEADIERRVAVHAESWHPSTFAEAHYRALTATWPYRPEFDVVVQAPDGRFVSSTLGWYDEANWSACSSRSGPSPITAGADCPAAGLAVLRALRDAGLTAQVAPGAMTLTRYRSRSIRSRLHPLRQDGLLCPLDHTKALSYRHPPSRWESSAPSSRVVTWIKPIWHGPSRRCTIR